MLNVDIDYLEDINISQTEKLAHYEMIKNSNSKKEHEQAIDETIIKQDELINNKTKQLYSVNNELNSISKPIEETLELLQKSMFKSHVVSKEIKIETGEHNDESASIGKILSQISPIEEYIDVLLNYKASLDVKHEKLELFAHNIIKNVSQKDFSSSLLLVDKPSLKLNEKPGEKYQEDE